MRKSDLVDQILSEKVDVLLVLENAFRLIKKNIASNQAIYIRGFGTFNLKTRAEKKARIVKKNIAITLPEKKIPFFKPSKEFSKIVDEKMNKH